MSEAELQICKVKNRTAELERLNLPKTCYETCELLVGPNSAQYRRAANFGGGDGVQGQGMGAFTGTNPNWPTQPWLGNGQGTVTNTSGGAHFYDRSGGRNARERLSHEAYLYIPAECVQIVTQIRFRSLGEQFAQIRISPNGDGDLTNATFVGQVSYLGPPNTRNIGAPVNVNQGEIYGVLAYVLDRQDNADVQIQYFNGTAWVSVPSNWLYPNLADAQQALSGIFSWCVQGGIGTNDVDDRRLTEAEIQALPDSAEVECCDPCKSIEELETKIDDLSNSADLDEQTLSTTEVGGITTAVEISNGNSVPINHPAPVVVPDQEICDGSFVQRTGRTGWTFPWTTPATANTGTVTDDWVQVSTSEVSPSCVSDVEVNVFAGNHQFQIDSARIYHWIDFRLLVNGVAVVTETYDHYEYLDDRNETIDTTNPLKLVIRTGGSWFAERKNVPAGATVSVEMRRRYNFNAFQTGGRARAIGGLRSKALFDFSPQEIVTGRV